jgi:hypothetical protein
MEKVHVFRFVDNRLNKELIALLMREAKGKFRMDSDGFVRYSHSHEDVIGNELICTIRSKVFPEWQVISFPAEWKDSYERYMTRHGIPFQGEIRDGSLRFFIPLVYRPHLWKLDEPSRLRR